MACGCVTSARQDAPGGSPPECVGDQAARPGRLRGPRRRWSQAASGGSPSRPRPPRSGAGAEGRGPSSTAAVRSGCATCSVGGRPVVLAWRKRIWRCREPACGVHTWTEQAATIRPRALLIRRARARALRRVGEDAHACPRRADLGVTEQAGGASLTTAPRWSTTLLVSVAAALGLDGQAFFGDPYGAEPMDHQSRQPGARPAARAGRRPRRPP